MIKPLVKGVIGKLLSIQLGLVDTVGQAFFTLLMFLNSSLLWLLEKDFDSIGKSCRLVEELPSTLFWQGTRGGIRPSTICLYSNLGLIVTRHDFKLIIQLEGLQRINRTTHVISGGQVLIFLHYHIQTHGSSQLMACVNELADGLRILPMSIPTSTSPTSPISCPANPAVTECHCSGVGLFRVVPSRVTLHPDAILNEIAEGMPAVLLSKVHGCFYNGCCFDQTRSSNKSRYLWGRPR